MLFRTAIIYVLLLIGLHVLCAQQRFGTTQDVIEVGESMEAYIIENHLEEIESIVHKFSESKVFLNYLLEKGHDIPHDSIQLKRKDVSIGRDIDVFVKHFTEHQNYTMLLVPVDIYPLMIYDTLLFSVVEVSDEFLNEKYYYHDLKDDSVKSAVLSDLNHNMITKHMFDQVMAEQKQKTAEVEVKLHESYISTNSISLNTHLMSKEEKREIMKSWGMMKKLFTHDLEMNVEMNIYIFGFDDMRIVHYTEQGEIDYRITPGNIFTRHHFLQE
ncbi:hypothetical protein [Marinoscillum pacificum]|uniref:hypothetical protein n=1 Tax=Marinoscillum pacificum TaxID=392723 RepID=UPI0021581C21|nr:hypothetical protein [Marinoscillum pacificum]